MDKRISLITLGSSDVPRARAFYEQLGWSDPVAYEDHTVFWQAGPMILGLYLRDGLAENSGLQDSGSYGGMVLAYNVDSPAQVDAVLADAESAGGRITAPAEKQSWGGYSGTFTDLDGHPWEVAHNPSWTIRDDGTISLAG